MTDEQQSILLAILLVAFIACAFYVGLIYYKERDRNGN